MNETKAEILAGVIGAAVFWGTLLALHWPWWLSAGLALMLYAGSNLVLGGMIDDRVRSLMAGTKSAMERLADQVDHNQRAVRELRELARAIEDGAICARVTAVCDLAEKMFANFRQDPDDLRKAHRFLSHFQKVPPIVENYVHLSSDPDRRAVMSADDEAEIAETLAAFETNLRDAYQAFQENNLQKLRMATGTLKRMIELDHTTTRDSGGKP